MVACEAGELLAGDWLGPPPHAPETAERLGDVVAIMKEGYALLSGDEPDFLKRMTGRHGGLTPEEMLVPWLIFHA